jgi:flagellar motor switch protein FliN/FliY
VDAAMSDVTSPGLAGMPDQPEPEPALHTPRSPRELSYITSTAEEQVEGEQANVGMIMDVVLNVSVELGRTHMTVRQVLDLDQDSVIELDRLAGEVVDVFVNDHLIARGEVVVVDDKFGVRISELISPTKTAEGSSA